MTDEVIEEIERRRKNYTLSIDDTDHLIAEVKQLRFSRDEWRKSYETRTQSHVEQAKKLFAEIKELRSERNEARAIAHERGLDASELEAQNRRLQDELTKAKADLGARNRILTEEP